VHQYSLRADWLESSFLQNHLRVLVDKMTMSQQSTFAAKKATSILAALERALSAGSVR